MAISHDHSGHSHDHDESWPHARPCARELRQGLRHRHHAQSRLRRHRSALRLDEQLGVAAGRRRTQSRRRPWPWRRVARQRPRQACADRALHLRDARLVDPCRPVQRGLSAGDGGGPLVGGHPASRIARTGGGQDDDGGRGDRHPRQRCDSVAFRVRPQGRHQPARRVPAYGVGRARVCRRRCGGTS